MNDVYLKIHGINGESKDAHHSGWMNIVFYNWGVQKEARNRPSHYRNLRVHGIIDKATPAILQLASNGNLVKEVILSACKAGGTQIEYYRITLMNVLIVDVLFTDGGTGTDVEYQFQADQVKLQYWEQSETGGKGAETRASWDIKNNTSV